MPRRKLVLNSSPQINEATEWLLERARSESGEGRRRAMMRLVYIFDADLMTEEQRGRLGALLWEKTDEHGLPDLPDLHCFKYLHLPSPEEVDAVSTVKEHILSLTPIRSVSVGTTGRISISGPGREDPMIFNAAFASKPAVPIPYEPTGIIEWSGDEAKKLWDKAIEWWDNEKSCCPSRNLPLFLLEPNIYQTIWSRWVRSWHGAMLPRMDSASEDEWNRLLAFLSRDPTTRSVPDRGAALCPSPSFE